jgi:hypothetical protein
MRPTDGRQADFSLRCLKVNLRLFQAFDQEVASARWSVNGFDTVKLKCLPQRCVREQIRHMIFDFAADVL